MKFVFFLAIVLGLLPFVFHLIGTIVIFLGHPRVQNFSNPRVDSEFGVRFFGLNMYFENSMLTSCIVMTGTVLVIFGCIMMIKR